MPPALNTPSRHKRGVYAETGKGVDTVIVGVEIVVQNGMCTKVDEAAIRRKVREVVSDTFRGSAELACFAREMHPHIAMALKQALDFPLPVNRYAAPL